MNEGVEPFGEAREGEVALQEVQGRGSWGEALAGTLPLLVIGWASGLYALSGFLPNGAWLLGRAFTLSFGGYLVVVIGLGVGWVRRFPRWSPPYIGHVLVFALYMMGVATPGFRIFGHTFKHNELWGWRAWIPFCLMAAMALLLTRSLRSLVHLARSTWRDWTRLTFGWYGIMPLVVWISFDEVDKRYQLPFLLASTLVLSGGALAYMRSTRTWQRALALLAGLTLSGIVATIGNAIYWHGRQEYWMKAPGNGYETALRMLMTLGMLIALFFAPALLGLLRREVTSPPSVRGAPSSPAR